MSPKMRWYLMGLGLVLALAGWYFGSQFQAAGTASSKTPVLPAQHAEDIAKAVATQATQATSGLPAGSEHHGFDKPAAAQTNAGSQGADTKGTAASGAVAKGTAVNGAVAKGTAVNGTAANVAAANGSAANGKGAGVFDARSKFKPMVARPDVIPWAWLTDVPTRQEGTRLLPVYNQSTLLLAGKTQRIQGYMLPLVAGEKQSKFVLITVPPTCPYCTPGGPESMVQVLAREPVAMSEDPVVAEGQFEVLQNDAQGFYYRLSDAVAVK